MTAPLLLHRDSTAAQASDFLLQHQIDGVRVIDDNHDVVGLIDCKHLLKLLSGGLPCDTPIHNIMSRDRESLRMLDELQYTLDKSIDSDGNNGLEEENRALYNLTIAFFDILQKKHQEWEVCLNSIYNPLVAVDDQERITLFNRSLEEVSGISAEDAYGKKINEVFDMSGLGKILKSGEKEKLQRIKYQGKTLLSNRGPITVDGKITGAVACLQDISELESVVQELEVTKKLNQQLDAIFESSYDGLYITDGEGNTLRLNKAFERIMGVYAEECVGRNMADLVKEGYFTRSGTLLVMERKHSVTIPLQSKTGKNALVTSNPIFDDEGNIVLIVTNVRDLTDLIKLEQELEDVKVLREREFEAILESSFDGLYITDGQGKTLKVNKGFERITGIMNEDISGRYMQDLVRDGVYTDSGTLLAIEKRGTVTLPLKANNKDILVTSTPIFDDDGQIMMVVTNVRDMTELKTLEHQLEQVEGLRRKELDAIIDSSYDGLYITDGSGNTLRLNQAFERIMGVTSDECVGRNMAELVREGVFTRSGTLLAIKSRQTATITLQSKTGKSALVTSNPIFDEDGCIILVVTNVRDITELNDLQGKVEQLEGLSRMYQVQLNQLKSSKSCILHSDKMRNLLKMVNHVSTVDSTVLILGESGVGKEVIADTLHTSSPRANKPFIKVNCGAIPGNLLESELFGYEPGAFTGASKSGKAGMFELADGGILFLDEIAEMPMDLQVKLLRVLQDNKIMRIGGTREITVDVRIIAGTNRNMQDMVAKQLFRKDLYYRLNVVPIFVPPLRERREDIPVLSKHFLEKFNRRHGMNKRLSAEVLKNFMSYDWPGNVRELENLIERLVVTTQHDMISVDDLAAWSELEAASKPRVEIVPLHIALENTERSLLQEAFSLYNSTYAVARVLGVSQPTVVRKAAKYGIAKAK
jgi:PAS domain S-box-containing protein